MIGRSARVGIVGAGAAGLSAAHALARAGYQRITVLEKSDRVGGKCSTFFYQGKSYELGAAALTNRYTNVNALMREQGVRATPGASGLFVDLDAGRRSFVPPPLREGGFMRLGVHGMRLLARLTAERRLHEPGFDNIAADLKRPFAEWARAHGAEAATALIAPWFTGFGYGYLEEVPAAYVLKYVALFGFPIYEILGDGYQGLWERVARGIDVRLGAGVRSIDRSGASGDPVVVESDAGRFAFDALILACPLDSASEFLDVSAEERELFSAIRTNDYHIVAARLDNAPNARYGFFSKHFSRDYAGEVVFFYRRWLENDLVLFYMLPREGTPLVESVAKVEATIERLGGRLRGIHLQHAWRYFPHVGPKDLEAGYYERLEALQGKRAIYLTGEICAFTTVESVVTYSRALVDRFFAKARG